jgi:hypothetical protein
VAVALTLLPINSTLNRIMISELGIFGDIGGIVDCGALYIVAHANVDRLIEWSATRCGAGVARPISCLAWYCVRVVRL